MKREFSAGGVLVRRLRGRWVFAAIRPAGKKPGLWALPKGQIDESERPEETAVREAAEETGAHGRVVEKLGDVRYVYTWDGERIFKVVSFYLLRYSRGRLGELPAETALRFPYHPHVTVGQDVTAEALDAVYADLAAFEADFTVEGFTLFEHDDGGHWRPYRHYSLSGIASRPSGDQRR